jgi:acetyl-CoA acyltransferase
LEHQRSRNIRRPKRAPVNLGIPDGAEHVNPNGGAIALGHPLGMSGARLVGTAARQLTRVGGTYALASMCIGVGQGISLLLTKP